MTRSEPLAAAMIDVVVVLERDSGPGVPSVPYYSIDADPASVYHKAYRVAAREED